MCQPKARMYKSLLTSYSPSGVEVFEGEEAVGDDRPAGWKAGQRENASFHGTWVLVYFFLSGVPPVVGLPCYELISTRLS